MRSAGSAVVPVLATIKRGDCYMPDPSSGTQTPKPTGPIGHLGHPDLRFKKGDRVRLISPEATECHRSGTIYKHIHDRWGFVKVLWDGAGASVVHESRLIGSGTAER